MVALQDIPLVPEYERRLIGEDELIGTFIEEFMKKQDRHVLDSGRRDRGTHAKGICFNGMFRTQTRAGLEALGYEESLIKTLKQGIFAPDSEYVTELRFSNAEGYRNPDNVADVRGISLSLDLNGSYIAHSGESKQDFIANNSMTFPVKDLVDFVPFFQFVTFVETKDPRYFPSPLKMGVVTRALSHFARYIRSDVKSYSNETYWSNVTAVHGMDSSGLANSISKIRIVPCTKKLETINTKGLSADYLSEQIVLDLRQDALCFDFQLQFFNEDKLMTHFSVQNAKAYKGWTKSDWIENSGNMIWPENLLPYSTVAKVFIPKNSLPIDCQKRAVNSRLHSTRDHTPIGNLARGRAVVEEASRIYRMKDLKLNRYFEFALNNRSLPVLRGTKIEPSKIIVFVVA